MMGLSIWHISVVLLIVLVLFGAGKLPHVMGDLGKGLRSFKGGLEGASKNAEPVAFAEIQQDLSAQPKSAPVIVSE